MLTFMDDASRKVFVYFLKSEFCAIFKDFKTLVENQTGKKIKVLRSDNGTEYVNKELEQFLKSSGIIPTPEQNGTAERMNCTNVEKARCILFDAGLGKHFWAEAVNAAAYIINRSATSGLVRNQT